MKIVRKEAGRLEREGYKFGSATATWILGGVLVVKYTIRLIFVGDYGLQSTFLLSEAYREDIIL